jgi:hypothetical protein
MFLRISELFKVVIPTNDPCAEVGYTFLSQLNPCLIHVQSSRKYSKVKWVVDLLIQAFKVA